MRRRRYLVLTGGLSLTLAGCTESAQNEPENGEEPTVESDGGDVEVLSDADVATVDIEYEGHWSGSVGNAGSVRTVEGEGSEAIDVPLEDTENGQLFLQLDDGRDERTVHADIGKDDDGTGTLTVRISIDGDVVSEGSTTEESDRVDLSVRVVRTGESDAEDPDNETDEPDDNDSEPETEPPEENATEQGDDPDEQDGDDTDEATEDDTAADSDSETSDSEDSTGSSADEPSDGSGGSNGASGTTESDGPESDDTAGTTDDSEQSDGSDSAPQDDVEGGEPEPEEPTDDASDTDSTQDDE